MEITSYLLVPKLPAIQSSSSNTGSTFSYVQIIPASHHTCFHWTIQLNSVFQLRWSRHTLIVLSPFQCSVIEVFHNMQTPFKAFKNFTYMCVGTHECTRMQRLEASDSLEEKIHTVMSCITAILILPSVTGDPATCWWEHPRTSLSIQPWCLLIDDLHYFIPCALWHFPFYPYTSSY